MTAPADGDTANQRALAAAVGRLRGYLERHAARAALATESAPPLVEPAAPTDAPPTLQRLGALFHLSPFERDLLLLCAAVDLDAAVAPLCGRAQGDPQHAYPTFGLALAALPGAHWSALSPAGPLRRWQLVEAAGGQPLTYRQLRIDERILHFLLGIHHLDERLTGVVEPLPIPSALAPSERAAAARLETAWQRASGEGAPVPPVQLCGSEAATQQAVAAAACATLGLALHRAAADLLPAAPHELSALARLWEREARLSGSALFLDCTELDAADSARVNTVARLVERLSTPLILGSRERLRSGQRPTVVFELDKPSGAEQQALWHGALGTLAPALNGHVQELTAQFNLSAQAIRTAGAQALAQAPADGAGLGPLLWEACRAQARPRLDDLAQRLDAGAVWDDLVLPEAQRQTLRAIAAHVRQRARVHDAWGFAARGSRGLGVSALFAGPSGTGKTTAAEALASELRLDLYRIDLSSVVSKYIGETEKNLRRVFDAAEDGGTILLFDEADALFGKRSEVKDSHDRYANIEVSYLLQRMEAYRGLAILTTNLKSSLDSAFLRRLRFIVHFPFPDPLQRAEIWRRIFPARTPTEGLEPAKLARLNVAGGNIRNIALYAAFLAADADEPVRMAHLLSAARAEYAKLEKPLTAAEIDGWD